MKRPVRVRWLGRQPYEPIYHRMRSFTAERHAGTDDELWLLEHDPVYTQGRVGDAAHLLDPGDIPVFQSNRGGQVTYHGPGQLMVYPLLDLRRHQLGVRTLVDGLEGAVIDALAGDGIHAERHDGAPGVYVGAAKLASLGLRVERFRSYHGLAVNVAMDLEPFTRINPCGYEGLAMTQSSDLGGPATLPDMARQLLPALATRLGLDWADDWSDPDFWT
ncbi:lipoyl(octanoyl) transferase LipB [uncultured Abyssibacter sp.]|uniref:lipoyl(octanoyl) transferase LipB n=1 Tax=uncultured Abyssibacter sp. TaxID=2320202 RepID=UPI0032B2B5DC